jgi:hypothetical protein
MRPHPDELLRSINKSLSEVIIPNIGDDWARYVARSMEKIVSHLELRWRHELEFTAEDTAELDELLRELQPALADLDDERVRQVSDAIRAQLEADAPPPAPDVGRLLAANEAYRATLQEVIHGLESAAGDAELRDRLEPLRERIRAYLRSELDRDRVLAEPTDMLFGPPTPRPAKAAS